MPSDVYRYRFDESVPGEEVETTLVLSVFAVEALHGEAQTRLDAAHAYDGGKRSVAIDASTAVGRDLNRVFVGLITREFGAASFRVERVPHKPQPETLTA